MTALEILTTIIEILVGGITQVASGLGSGISTLVEGIFLTTVEGTTTLSTFGGLIIVFAGVSLALGLCRWVVNWLTSLGN